MIDCGEGAQLQMVKNKVPFARIDNIFISHLHGDHVFGLWGFIYTLDMMGRLAPLHVYAPKGLDEILNFIQAHFGKLRFEIAFHEVKCAEPEIVCSFRQMDIYAFPLKHRVETYGYLFKEKEPRLNIRKEAIEEYGLSYREIARLKDGEDVIRENVSAGVSGGERQVLSCKELTYKPYEARSFAYCSDTAPFKKLAGWIKGATLLYHEATYASDLKKLAKVTLHSTSEDAASCALEAGAGRLVLGHFSSRYKGLEALLREAQAIFPNTVLAADGINFEI